MGSRPFRRVKVTEPSKRHVDSASTHEADLSDGGGESRRESVAEMLDNVASRLHEKADAGGERVMGLGHGAADKVEATARYVRDHPSREMIADVEAFVKKHPGKSLLAVAVFGFLAGRAFRGDK